MKQLLKETNTFITENNEKILIELILFSHFNDEFPNIVLYGIRISVKYDGKEETKEMFSISSIYENVERLFYLMLKCKITTISFNEVVEDYVAI